MIGLMIGFAAGAIIMFFMNNTHLTSAGAQNLKFVVSIFILLLEIVSVVVQVIKWNRLKTAEKQRDFEHKQESDSEFTLFCIYVGAIPALIGLILGCYLFY